MDHNKVIDEIIDELFDDVFGKELNPLYGKFVDKDGVYEFKNGSFIKIINNNPEDNVRGKRAKIIMQDDENITKELIDEVLTPFRGL